MVYSIVDADLHRDEDDVIQLWQRNFNRDFTQRYAWLYKNNPTPPLCLLLKSQTNETVGMLTFVPRQLFIHGKPVTAGHTIDFVVDSKHRSGGPAIKLQKELLVRLRERGIQCVYGIPLPAASLIQRRVGYQLAGTYSRWVKPLRSGKWLGRHPHLGKLAPLISPFVDLGLSVRSRDVLYRSRADLTITETLPEAAEIDTLSEKMGALFTISGRRSHEYLTWRFLYSPIKKYRYFTVTRTTGVDNAQLLGSIVYHLDDTGAYISDLMYADDTSIYILLHEFSRALRKQASASLELRFFGEPHQLVAALRKTGFFQRPEDATLLVLSNDTHITKDLLLNPYNWFLTGADIDI